MKRIKISGATVPLIFPFLQLFYPFTSLFLFSFTFSHFLSPFFLFLLHFPPFLFASSYFFPQMTSADISPPGGEYFPIYWPLGRHAVQNYQTIDIKRPTLLSLEAISLAIVRILTHHIYLLYKCSCTFKLCFVTKQYHKKTC